ncbi:MAG: hypothetical protein JO337_05810 [Acidimicrobiales bacterium]|nr:hypothetical protein [Acidimicrobiales bacterium]
MALLATAVTACSSGGHRRAQSTTVPPTTVAPPTSSTEPAPVYAPSPFVWQRETSPALALGGGATASLAALLPPGQSDPWTVVGTRVSETGTPAATIWTSGDGNSWTGSALAPSGANQALAASRYRGATVVVGDQGEGANEQAAVWLSAAPGAPFTAQQVPVSDGPSVMTLVTQGALGLFAVGTVDGRFAMWSSTTGARWGELPDAEKVIASTPGARVNALLAEGDLVYAAGSVPAASGTEAAVWSSSDGLHWHLISTAASSFTGAGSRVIYSLAPLGTGLVATGAINRGNGWMPASWISPDGVSWSQPSTSFSDVPALPGTGTGTGSAALAVSAVNTVSGSTSVVASGGGPTGERAWRSVDGLHWSSIALPGPAAASNTWRPTLIAGTTSTTVMADGDPGQPHVLSGTAAGWTEPSSDPSVFGPVQPQASPLRVDTDLNGLTLQVQLTTAPQSIGPAVTTIQTLRSVDGSTWQAAAPGSSASPSTLPTPGATGIQVAAGAWVAVGMSAGAYPEAWTSPTGSTWASTGALDPVSATTGTRPGAEASGLCTTSRSSSSSAGTATAAIGVVAVGTALTPVPASASPPSINRSAAAWWSAAGVTWHRSPVTPGPALGSDEAMIGCLDTGNGLAAYGSAAGSGGAPAPGLWRSATGASWTRQSVAAFAAGVPGPITDLASAGSDWLAVADPAQAPAGSIQSSPVGPVPTIENGMNGMWLSSDSGQTWQRVNVTSAPWPGTLQTQVELCSFAGTTPLVVGAADGRLAVWIGTPIPPGTAASTG